MLHKRLTATSAVLAAALIQTPAAAQKLHVNPRWEECSFQLDPSLTQSAWHRFAREAGLVVYFRSLDDARPLGKGKFEVSALQWQTKIDDSAPAWNDTFVHPDSTHWLIEGSALMIPGLSLRAGVGGKTDVAVYATKAPGANYGFYGGAVQRNVLGGESSKWNASARTSFIKMYGPEDVDLSVYGADVIVSRTMTLSRWATVSPYVGVSGYLSRAHEKTTHVDLADENVFGTRGAVGAELRVFKARFAAEYNAARVGGMSLKIGFGA
jgi:hypothetical protein